MDANEQDGDPVHRAPRRAAISTDERETRRNAGPMSDRASAPVAAPAPSHPGAIDEIELLVSLLAKLPGLGPRSARRAVLHLLNRRSTLLEPLAACLTRTRDSVRNCRICGNLSSGERCGICLDPERDATLICVVESVADLWALERTQAFRGHYHVLGGTLSAVGNVRPEDLRIPDLARRAENDVCEVVLALNATFDGQTTAHYIARSLSEFGVRTTRIGFGVPVGGELGYLDSDTIAAAFRARGDA